MVKRLTMHEIMAEFRRLHVIYAGMQLSDIRVMVREFRHYETARHALIMAWYAR